MTDNNPETLADIAAELRNLADSLASTGHGMICIHGNRLADRIEAAAERERAANGNAAVMRNCDVYPTNEQAFAAYRADPTRPIVGYATWLFQPHHAESEVAE